MLALLTGQIDATLQHKLEYVLAEKHAYRALLERHSPHWRLTDPERKALAAAGIKPVKLPPQSPNLNAFAERWVRSVKEECLDQLILFGEKSLAHVLKNYIAHHQQERNHQGLAKVIPFPDERLTKQMPAGKIVKAERLGGLLNFY